MAKRKTRPSIVSEASTEVRMPPSSRFEFDGSLPANLPQVNKPVRFKVDGTLIGASAPEYSGDRHSIRVRLHKVTVAPGKRN